MKIFRAPIVRETVAIQWVFQNRKVSRLCHMTEIENLLNVLANECGIQDRNSVGKKAIINDYQRFDGKPDYISTSIEFPNTWYYKKKKGNYDWAVIFIDTAVCNENNTLFCEVNAATLNGYHIGAGYRKLEECFKEAVYGAKLECRDSNMLECCPTSDQAEVMIKNHIPTNYISGIAFETEEVAKKFLAKAQEQGITYPTIYVAPGLFTTELSVNIRNGIRPEERIFKEA